MNKIFLTPIILAIATLFGACSTAPTTTSLLEQTRSDYRAAQSNPGVASYAPLEMKQAGEALEQANAAANHKDSAEKVDKLAYLAKQKIALTQEVAKQKTAEAQIASSGKARDQIRLDQRTNEADQAKTSAEQSKLAAQEAQDQAAQGMASAQKLANVLRENPRRTVLVEGFADSTGSSAHNQGLSERRAGAVQTALLELGVSRERVVARGYGESYPVASNDTAQSRQLNRRVEIVLSDDGGRITPR